LPDAGLIQSREERLSRLLLQRSRKLEDTLLSMPGVLEAHVHLFAESSTKKAGSSSVFVLLAQGADSGSSGIQTLVSGATGVSAESVSVVTRYVGDMDDIPLEGIEAVALAPEVSDSASPVSSLLEKSLAIENSIEELSGSNQKDGPLVSASVPVSEPLKLSDLPEMKSLPDLKRLWDESYAAKPELGLRPLSQGILAESNFRSSLETYFKAALSKLLGVKAHNFWPLLLISVGLFIWAIDKRRRSRTKPIAKLKPSRRY